MEGGEGYRGEREEGEGRLSSAESGVSGREYAGVKRVDVVVELSTGFNDSARVSLQLHRSGT